MGRGVSSAYSVWFNCSLGRLVRPSSLARSTWCTHPTGLPAEHVGTWSTWHLVHFPLVALVRSAWTTCSFHTVQHLADWSTWFSWSAWSTWSTYTFPFVDQRTGLSGLSGPCSPKCPKPLPTCSLKQVNQGQVGYPLAPRASEPSGPSGRSRCSLAPPSKWTMWPSGQVDQMAEGTVHMLPEQVDQVAKRSSAVAAPDSARPDVLGLFAVRALR